MKEDYFEKKLVERLGSQEMVPPVDLWQRIEASMNASVVSLPPIVIDKKRRYIGAIIGTATAAAVLLLSFLFTPISKEGQDESIAEISIPLNPDKTTFLKGISPEPKKILAESRDVDNKNKETTTTKPARKIERKSGSVSDNFKQEESIEEKPEETKKDTTPQETHNMRKFKARNTSNNNTVSQQSYNNVTESSKKQNRKGVKLNISGTGNFLSSSSSTKANVFSVGVKSLNSSPLLYENTPKELDWKHSIPISVSASVQKMFTRRIGIEAGLTYSYLSSRAAISSNPKVEVKQKLHYLGIPLSVVCNIAEAGNFGFYAKGGFMVDKAISTDYRIYLESKSVKEDISTKGVQWSANMQLGASYKIGNLVSLYLEPTVNYYFDSSQPASYRTENSVGFSAILGVRFHLR